MSDFEVLDVLSGPKGHQIEEPAFTYRCCVMEVVFRAAQYDYVTVVLSVCDLRPVDPSSARRYLLCWCKAPKYGMLGIVLIIISRGG